MTSKYCEYIFISGLGAHHRAHLNQNDLQSQQPPKTQEKYYLGEEVPELITSKQFEAR